MCHFSQIGVRREVGKEEGQALADLLGALFIETSAKQVHLVCPFIKVGWVFVPQISSTSSLGQGGGGGVQASV